MIVENRRLARLDRYERRSVLSLGCGETRNETLTSPASSLLRCNTCGREYPIPDCPPEWSSSGSQFCDVPPDRSSLPGSTTLPKSCALRGESYSGPRQN